MTIEEVHDIVIVGGGICGLALSLGLHRKGIKSLVLERSEVLRSEGAAIDIHGNGWHALDQLKVGADLRNSILLTGMQYEYVSKDEKNFKPSRSELRCLRRKDLMETLANHLPSEQIRFGCHVTSLDFDHGAKLHVLSTLDGAVIKAKVLIGCDGSYSVVAKSLQLASPKYFPIWITRGITTYRDKHSFGNYFLVLATQKGFFGGFPINDKSIHFFVTHFDAPTGDMTDPAAVRKYNVEWLKGSPSEIVDTMKNCDLEALSMRRAGYRSPWALLHQKFRRGTMTVAGDAMHVMGPFIGQGGSAALEDAVVLTRCLSNAINATADYSSDEKWVENVEDALDLYIKERRPRIMRLCTQSYLVGTLLSTKSWLVKLIVILILSVFFGGNSLNHALFDCGTI